MDLARSLFTHIESAPIYENIIVFVDKVELPRSVLESTCESLTIGVPFQQEAREIEFIGPAPPEGSTGVEDSMIFVTPSVMVDGQSYQIDVITNAISCAVSLDKEEKKLHLDISNEKDEDGYLELTIPHSLLGGNFTIMVDGKVVEDYTIMEDGEESTTLVIKCDSSANSVDVIGATVVPEFDLAAIMLVVAIAGSVVAHGIFKRAKKSSFL